MYDLKLEIREWNRRKKVKDFPSISGSHSSNPIISLKGTGDL